MKKLLRLGFSIGLGALCIGILTLVASLLSWIKLVDVYTVVSSSVIAGVYIGVGVLGMLLGFIFYPKMMRGIAGGMKRIEAKLTQVPMQDVLSGILGLIVGLILALLLSTLINRIPIPWLSMLLSVIVYALLGYLGVAVAVRRKSELGIVEKITEAKGAEEHEETEEEPAPRGTVTGRSRKKAERQKPPAPKILDTSVIIDGRVLAVANAGFLEGKIIVPSFVLQELRHIADSADALRRQRGRRGLDILQQMQQDSNRVVVIEKEYENTEVDEQLILLAKEMKGNIVTNDFNLNKVATVKGVKVLNINELASSLKPAVMPGEDMLLQIVREGKEPGQGVAYLEDGTMVVVDSGASHIGSTTSVYVTSVLQTAAGRMVFAKAN